MVTKRFLKRVVSRSFAKLRAFDAWLFTRRLKDGDYFVPYQVYHATLQPSMSETFAAECQEFGDDVARRWSRDGCGIAAIKSAITSLRRTTETQFSLPSISELSEEMFRNGAYLNKVGWIHPQLVKFAQSHKLAATNYTFEEPLVLCLAILRAKIPIVSVTLYFRGGESRVGVSDTPPLAKGGHLVVLKGFRWERGNCAGFYVDDSQNRVLREGEDSKEFVPRLAFSNSYSGKAIYVWR